MLNYQRVPQNPQLFSDHSFFVGDSGWMACGAFKRQIRADGSCNMSNGSCATRSDWLVIGCFKKRWNIYRSSHFLFDYIDMTYIFIWRYDLYDLYEDMTSSPQSIGMIVPGSLERLNHKNNLKKKTPTSSSSSWYLRNIWKYLERLAARMGLPLSLPAARRLLGCLSILRSWWRKSEPKWKTAIASANMAGKSWVISIHLGKLE